MNDFVWWVGFLTLCWGFGKAVGMVLKKLMPTPVWKFKHWEVED